MKKYLLLVLSTLMLQGCHALNFQTEPKIADDCQYQTMQGVEFQFNQLAAYQLNKGFKQIYVAQSKESATLSAEYQGMKGKLTGKVIERNYPKMFFWGHRPSPFRDSLLYDDGYEDLYLTPRQREIRDRKAKYIFHQAILQNCQIVYISVDSLAPDTDNPALITGADLTIIN